PVRVARGFRRQPGADRLLDQRTVLILQRLFAATGYGVQPGFVDEPGLRDETIGEGVPVRVARGFRRQPGADRLLHQRTVLILQRLFAATGYGVQPGFVDDPGLRLHAARPIFPVRVARGFRRQPGADRLLHQRTVLILQRLFAATGYGVQP